MKRKVLTLVVIVLALTSMGARRRSVGGARACAALKQENVVVKFVGPLSGCANGNGVQCQIGESIGFTVTTASYDATCGDHQLLMKFGDTRSESRTVKGTFPSFTHTYSAAGGYPIEATVSNGQSSVKNLQMLMVKAPDDDDGIY